MRKRAIPDKAEGVELGLALRRQSWWRRDPARLIVILPPLVTVVAFIVLHPKPGMRGEFFFIAFMGTSLVTFLLFLLGSAVWDTVTGSSRPARRRHIDAAFAVPQLAEVYDIVDGERSDLDVYAAMADEFGARHVLDVGCGTGTFCCLLASRGIGVTGVDPAFASLEVARRKPGADQVLWLHGDATDLPPMQVDMAVMTGNVAQVFLRDEDWAATLRGIHAALWPGGRLIFETRDPERKAWLEWNRAKSLRRYSLPDGGELMAWVDRAFSYGTVVSFQWTYEFSPDGAVLTSDSMLRFRTRDEVTASLEATGFTVDEVRDAPDRPGKEMVFVASRGN